MECIIVVGLLHVEALLDFGLWFVFKIDFRLLKAKIRELLVIPLVNIAALILVEPAGNCNLSDLFVAPVLVVERWHEAEIRIGNFAEKHVGRDMKAIDDVWRDAEDEQDPKTENETSSMTDA